MTLGRVTKMEYLIKGRQLLMTIVGDSLLEPFWPEGTGCARGFLSCMDAAWMFRRWVQGRHNPLDIICERENIYRYCLIDVQSAKKFLSPLKEHSWLILWAQHE